MRTFQVAMVIDMAHDPSLPEWKCLVAWHNRRANLIHYLLSKVYYAGQGINPGNVLPGLTMTAAWHLQKLVDPVRFSMYLAK